MYDGNPKAEWNQNILRNLLLQHPELVEFDKHKLLKEYDDYSISDRKSVV